MTIEQANQYFAALPDGFASTEQLHTAFTAPVQKVQFVGVAGTAGKTVVARLLAANRCSEGASSRACSMPPPGRSYTPPRALPRPSTDTR